MQELTQLLTQALLALEYAHPPGREDPCRN